jgi:hypothetical protein
VGTYEFRLPVEGKPEDVALFAEQLLDRLLDRRDVHWQRVADCRDKTIYAALTVDGPMERAARLLTDAFNETLRLVPGVSSSIGNGDPLGADG